MRHRTYLESCGPLCNRPDLIVAEKFAEQEQSGAGLVDDILAVIAEGLTILVLVPEPGLASWRELTGGETEEVPCEAGALRRWWRAGDRDEVCIDARR